VTAEALSAITGELGSWQTHYKERGNRRTNIVTACSKINGAVLMAGELFSYNRVVGPRDEGAGFRLAPVIVKGRMVPGMGGGVCQTSSTLYNAVLRAGLEIVSRRHHAFPVHYVPPGLDATVVYPSIDLQFRNNTGAPIVLLADSSRQRVQVRVLGSKVEGRKVEILRTGLSSWAQKTLTVTQGGLAPGKRVVLDKGHAGHRATVWRVIRDPGQTERRERISSDIYGAVPRLVAVGAAAPSAQTASPQIPAAASSPLPSSAPISQAAPALR
jgi:vancomycin resistance protein VanW